jgi:hypothetical protein
MPHHQEIYGRLAGLRPVASVRNGIHGIAFEPFGHATALLDLIPV